LTNRARYALLTLRALWELARYDLVNVTFGFKRMHRQLASQRARKRALPPEIEKLVVDAVGLAGCFYYKPVLCLQRSVVAARLLRNAGVDARLVIGYRAAPFLSHAWVEVEDRVVNDSQAYKERLQVLCTI
jgi:hypothetical protein